MWLALFACTSAPVQETADSGIGFDDTDLVAAIEQDMADLDATAFAMAVLRDGEVVWSRGFGDQTAHGGPVTTETRFRVASLTKPMTAVVTLQQVEQGCLDLDGRVDATLDGFVMQAQPTLAEGLRVRDTLQMTGGLADYDTQSGEDGDGQIEPFLDAYLANLFFLVAPGRMYNYSNPNFVVAGRLIEVCTGTAFHPHMAQSLWSPLGMDRTTMSTTEVVDDADYVVGVTTNWPGQAGVEVPVDAEAYSASHLWPAMGAWSSVDDMGRFAAFLMQGDEAVLSDALLAEMQSIQADTEEGFPEKGYGYGVDIKTGIRLGDQHYPVTMVSHTGALYGYSTHLYLVPELDVGVVALINRDKASPTHSVPAALDLAARVAPYTPDIPVPDAFGDYVGTYQNDFNIGAFVLTETEAGLEVDVPAFDDAGLGYEPLLEPVRPDNFRIHFTAGSADDLSFIRDASGEVEYLRNRNYVGAKDESAQAAQPSTPKRSDSALWAQWEDEMALGD